MTVASVMAWLIVGSAHASNLRQVQVDEPGKVNLVFDSRVAVDRVKTEYFGDIVQLSIPDSTVYPAKIASVAGSGLKKVFAYQFAPRLVRCRLTVAGAAERLRGRLKIDGAGKILTVTFPETALGGEKASGSTPSETDVPRGESGTSDEEKALLERVVAAGPVEAGSEKTGPAPETPVAKEIVPSGKTHQEEDRVAAVEKKEAGGGDAGKTLVGLAPARKLPGIGRVLAAFFGTLMAALGALFAFARLRRVSGAKQGMLRAIARFTERGFGRGGQMIEVLATQSLGPKKSIAMVKAGGRTLVLGVTDDSISLIAELPAGQPMEPMEDAADSSPAARPASISAEFAHILSEKTTAPIGPERSRVLQRDVPTVMAAGGGIPGAKASPAIGARARVRSRLEGLKPL